MHGYTPWPGRLRRTLRSALLVAACGCFSALAHAQAATGVQATTIPTTGPSGVAYDTSGNLYIALRDDHRILKVDTLGLVTTIAGTGEQGFGGDNGPATDALLDSPAGIAVATNGTLYIADSHNHRIRAIISGTITTVAGTGTPGYLDGAAAVAQLNLPLAVSVDASGNLYIADANNHRIRKLAAGIVSTVAGSGEQTFSGDGGPASAAALDTPSGVAADTTIPGRFYISDTRNQRIRVVDATGTISTVTATGLAHPLGLSVNATGTLLIADSDNNRIRSITNGSLTPVAGTGEQGISGDTASPTAAVLDSPHSVAAGPAGTLAIADTHNQRTRAISSSLINTVAGTPPAGTEGILLSAPLSSTFGTGTLTATFQGITRSPTGTATLLDGGAVAGTAPWSGNTATFNLSALEAGLHTLAVTYPGDTANAATASGVYLVTTTQAAQTLDFTQPATPLVFTPGLTVPLAAISSAGLPVTYTVASGRATIAGSTLTITGGGTVIVTAQSVGRDYTTVTANRTIVINPGTPTVSWTPPADIVFGAALGTAQLNASSPVAGTFTYSPAPGTVLGGGSQLLKTAFTPADPASYTAATQTVPLIVRQATPVVTFATPPYTIVGTQLSSLQLNAAATGVTGAILPGTFTYSPSAGAVVTAGPQILTARFTPADSADYTGSTATVTLNGTALTLASVSPATAQLGDAATKVTLTGTGFAPDAVVGVNGIPVATTFGNNGTLTAIIPAASLTNVQTLQLAVLDPSQNQASGTVPFLVKAPGVNYTVTAPTTTPPGTQPAVTLTLTNPYPVSVTGTFTLSFTPSGNGVDDPAIQFATGGRTLTLTVGAGQTAAPAVQLQSGTVSGIIQIKTTLSAGGVDVTPTGVAPTNITVPSVAPTVSGVSLTRIGRTLTVASTGFSNTREVTQAIFHFVPADGQKIQTQDATIDVTGIFAGWFGQSASVPYGSEFLYTQVFTLDDDASVVGQVQVTLTNSAGTSASSTTP